MSFGITPDSMRGWSFRSHIDHLILLSRTPKGLLMLLQIASEMIPGEGVTEEPRYTKPVAEAGGAWRTKARLSTHLARVLHHIQIEEWGRRPSKGQMSSSASLHRVMMVLRHVLAGRHGSRGYL